MKRTSDVTGPAPLKTKRREIMQAARRNLLKTGLMCTGAAAAAGVSPGLRRSRAQVEDRPRGVGRRRGGRGASRASAPRSKPRKKGAKVLLIEKMGRPDCTSAYSSGWIAATKTRYQDKDDDDSKELYFKEMMEVSGGRSDPAPHSRLCRDCGRKRRLARRPRHDVQDLEAARARTHALPHRACSQRPHGRRPHGEGDARGA